MNFLLRVYSNMLGGIIAAGAWSSAAGWYWTGTTWRTDAVVLAAAAWSSAALYFWSYLDTTTRRRFRTPVTCPVLVAVSFVGFFVLDAQGDGEQAAMLMQRAIVPAVLLAGPLAIANLVNRIHRSDFVFKVIRTGEGHNARWSNRHDFNRYEVTIPVDKDGRPGWLDCFVMGSTTPRHDVSPRYIGISSAVHLLTLAMSNAGKSATMIWNNLALYGGAVFVIDMKGEHAYSLDERRAQLGPVTIFDPFDINGRGTARYNPLLMIVETTDEGLERIAEIRKAIILPEHNTMNGGHFADNAGTLIDGVIAYVCTLSEEKRNLVTVYLILASIDPESDAYDPEVWADAVVAMSECPIGQARAAAKLMDDAGKNEAGGFLTTVSKSVKWLAPKGIQYMFSGNTANLADLATQGPEKPTFFVVVGMGKEEDYSRYIRLMTAMAVYELRQAYLSTNRKPEPGCLLALDEYPLFAEGLKIISTGFGTLREIGAILWVQAQKRSQLISAIGEQQAKLLFQSSTVQVFGVNNDDDDTAAWVSERLGKHVVRKKRGVGMLAEEVEKETVDLVPRRTVHDVLRQHDPDQFVFPADGVSPMWLHRNSYAAFRIKGRRRFRAIPELRRSGIKPPREYRS